MTIRDGLALSDEKRDRPGTGDGLDTGDPNAAGHSLSRRLFWFAALWLGGVAAVSLVAWCIRLVIMP